MNYFYDLLINLTDGKPFEFYEWQKDDVIIHLKKVPIFKIKTDELKKLMTYNIKVDPSFLEKIQNKTESYDQKKIIEYMALFTDENNSILLEFAESGKSIARSKLLLEEELDLLEIAYSLKKTELDYEILEPLEKNQELRQVKELKHFLQVEINTLTNDKNVAKLRYLYNEVFNQDSQDLDQITKALEDIIKSDLQDSHLKLFDLIKLSYKHLST